MRCLLALPCQSSRLLNAPLEITAESDDAYVVRIQIVQSRQRLHQRRQSIVAGRRASCVGSTLPPPPAHLLRAAAGRVVSPPPTPPPESARTPSTSDVRSSQACSVQWSISPSVNSSPPVELCRTASLLTGFVLWRSSVASNSFSAAESCLMRNSAVADKPRDAFVQYSIIAMTWPAPYVLPRRI